MGVVGVCCVLRVHYVNGMHVLLCVYVSLCEFVLSVSVCMHIQCAFLFGVCFCVMG